MPIRMTDDDDANSGYSGNQEDKIGGGGNGGGGGFPGGALIGMLLPLLMRNPKLLIPAIIIGGLFFFFKGGCSGGGTDNKVIVNPNKSSYGTGATLDSKVYDSTDVYASLSPDEQSLLPERVSLERFAPSPGDQGQQGSCVGWGSAYCAQTILQSVSLQQNPEQIKFSPAFAYNQIGLEGCQGTYIDRAMDLMTERGGVPFNKFPYDENSCSKQPDNYVLKEAEVFKIKGANRLSISGEDYTCDVNAMRENLAHNAPVVIGMMVGGTFMQEMEGKEAWIPTNSDYNQSGFGGHCMCVIGYDDYKFENDGGFLIQNSWGPRWGKNGRAWVSYKDFVQFANEAYGVYPLPDKANETRLSCAIGLVDKDTKQMYPLVSKGNNLYAVNGSMKIGAKFKVQLKNNIECYVYVFGKEVDNSSYVLFPYTPKHSAYCGITGTRVFPRDKSMTPDDKGNKDYIAVVVSKKALDFKTLNEKFNSNKTADFQQRINEVLANDIITNVQFKNDTRINFVADTKDKSIIPFIIEIQKQ